MARSFCLVMLVLVLGGCNDRAERSEKTRPDWAGASIEGIAPLMSPAEVEKALTEGGYSQVPCASGRPLLDNPLREGEAMPCYTSPSRRMKISLYFLDLPEGRRLAVADFRAKMASGLDEDESLAASRAYADGLRERFGEPHETVDDPSFLLLHWRRPGGLPSLPDVISTTVGADFGANVSLQSLWAYGEKRPASPSSGREGSAP